MREEVEHSRSRAISRTSNTKSDEHVTKLADSREGQYTLEVPLCYSNCSCKDRGESTYPGNHLECLRSSHGKEWESTSHHVNTSGDHSSGMDQCADRCRA